MSEEKPGIFIDTDWKKQAQEEKRKLVEQDELRRRSDAPAAATGATGAGPTTASTGTDPRSARKRELPSPSFHAIVESLATQVYFYLGDLAPRGSEPQMNLDGAKFQIDLLGVLEEKTRGNLSDAEKTLLDAALYETRMRYVSVASQFIS